MRTVTNAFQTEVEKQTANALYQRFIYNGVNRSAYPKNYGVINLDAKYIISGSLSLDLVNSDKIWNMFITDETNLRKTATVELGVDVAGAIEYLTLFTGILDAAHFISDYVDCIIRNKMVKMLEKTIGSSVSPVSYAAHNPADLIWHVLEDYGEISGIANDTNPDIDYDLWDVWKTDCDDVSLSLKARFTGQTIAHILNRLRFLTTSIIFVRGDGKFVFYRYSPILPNYLNYTDGDTHLVEVTHSFNELVNNITCRYDYDPPPGAEDWDGSVNEHDDDSKDNWGEVVLVEEDTMMWHDTEGSATEFARRHLQRYKDPLEFCSFNTGLKGYVNEPGDLIYLTSSFFPYSVNPFEITKVTFRLNEGKVRITALNIVALAASGFILDHTVLGLLDQDYNPLF